jgi:hypothetical protein
VFPELTPYGREFKLGGFTASSEAWDKKKFPENLPISVSVIVSRISTRKTSADAEAEIFATDRQTRLQLVGLYYAGKIAGDVGALVQWNYDGIEKKALIEIADVRYAKETTLGKDKRLVFGFTANNNPTISDIYNSTPMWGFPSPMADRGVMPNAATLVDNRLFAQVAGFGAYGLWNDLLYAELAVYRRAARGLLRQFSNGNEITAAVDGTAPYWRFALQHEAKPHSFSVGTYGMVANVFPDPTMPLGATDRFRDIAIDGQYQYIGRDHTLSAQATWIRERQDWNASFPLGLTSNASDRLKTFRANLNYYYQRRWGGGIQYFATSGSADGLRYNTGETVTGSASGSPNTRGWNAEVNYLPLEYLKLGVRYTAYSKFNGAGSNYDGLGRSAKDNNTLFLYGWILF